MDTKSLDAKMLLNVKDLQTLGLSRSMAYRFLHMEDMPTVRIGSRLFMHKEKFLEWLEQQADGAEA